jgi:RNA polymerase sigma-70 factor (TIGR02943 family)
MNAMIVPQLHSPRFHLNPSQWIAEYRDYLVRFALQRVNDHGQAEDLVQDTFLSAWNARDSFRGDCTERTWLTGVLRNKIVDHWRRTARRPLLLAGDFDEERGADGPHTPWLENRANDRDTYDPDTAAERTEMLALLDEAVNRLPESMGRAYRMREMQGRTTEEITRTLNISKANLWVLIHRAKQLLREQLQSAWLGTEIGPGTKLAA